MVNTDLVVPGTAISAQEVRDLETIVHLEAARLDAPVDLVRNSASRTLSSVAAAPVPGTTTPTLLPENLEGEIKQLLDDAGDGTALTRKNVKELVLLRAKSEGLNAEQLAALDRDFEELYFNAHESLGDVARFSEILSELDSSYTNVHLFRDGLFLSLSDEYFKRLTGKTEDVRAIYVSRDTIGEIDSDIRLLVTEANNQAHSLPEFRQLFQEEFEKLMRSDPNVRAAAESAIANLERQGLLKPGAKLRFVDTCCWGTMNMFLEGAIHHYYPDIETASLLMGSNGKYLGSGLRGYAVEGTFKPVEYAGYFDPSTGSPVMKVKFSPAGTIGDEATEIKNNYGPEAEQVLAYLDELVTLQRTSDRARGIIPEVPVWGD